MSDYLLDFTATGADGSATFSSASGGDDVTVTVSTPTNWNGDSFSYGNGVLSSGDVCNDTSANIGFDTEVSDVTFEIYDVDAGWGWDDQITIIALDADGNQVPVNFSDLAGHHQVNGNSVEGGGNVNPGVDGSGAADTVRVTIPGPIVSLQIIHDNGDSDGSSGTVRIADISFDVAGPVADGIVSGTAGDDVIDVAYTGDPEGDMIDNGDAILPGEGPQDDIVLAGAGDDLVLAGDGDDEIHGGSGNDTLHGMDGDDEIHGDDGDDLIRGGSGNDDITGGSGNDNIAGQTGNDTIDGGAGNDMIFGGAGDDTLIGGAGDDKIEGSSGEDYIEGGDGDDDLWGGLDDDTIHGGAGNDIINGGAGNDTITAGDGCDVVEGGTGNDVIDTSGSDPRSDYGFPGLIAPDADPYDDRDVVDGGAGNDTITTGDDEDIITGGAGNDTIDGGLDDDTITGDEGDDVIIGGHGSDTIDGGTGDDVIWGGLGAGTDPFNIPDEDIPGDGIPVGDLRPDNGIDVIHGGDGNDTIYGQDDADELYGDAGNDTIDGGIDNDYIDGGSGDDTLIGGQGEDTIIGGAGADTMSGGDDEDTFSGITFDDILIDGGSGGTTPADDHDVLDLTGSTPVGGSMDITINGPDSNGNGFDGYVTYFDSDGNVVGTVQFEEIEEVVPCFTPGTMVATPKGERLVEELGVGDKIITRDNGIQEICWLGAKKLDRQQLAANPHLKPILIRAGSLGNDLPERDMMVSPNHRMLIANDRTSLYFEEREVLAAAKHMVNNRGVHEVETLGATYIHFMFERHEVVLANGAWTESFQPGDYSLKGLGNAQRSEIFDLFPELKTTAGVNDYQAARKVLKKHEARLLVR